MAQQLHSSHYITIQYYPIHISTILCNRARLACSAHHAHGVSYSQQLWNEGRGLRTAAVRCSPEGRAAHNIVAVTPPPRVPFPGRAATIFSCIGGGGTLPIQSSYHHTVFITFREKRLLIITRCTTASCCVSATLSLVPTVTQVSSVVFDMDCHQFLQQSLAYTLPKIVNDKSGALLKELARRLGTSVNQMLLANLQHIFLHILMDGSPKQLEVGCCAFV